MALQFDKVDTLCAVCGKVQYNTPSGITCGNGHGGAESVKVGQPTPRRNVGLSPTLEAPYVTEVKNALIQSQQEPQPAPRQSIIQSLQAGVQALASAYKQGTEANPMCADVAVFQRMTAMQKELGAMMLEVNKMRGL